MSSTIFANPFKAERPKVEVPKRRSVHTGQPSPDEISRADLDKHLRALVEGKQVDPAIEAKFNTYLTTGNSFGYLDDTAIRQLFTSYVKKQIADGNSDNILKFLGPESVFNDYIERKRFKSDSIESQLFDYVLLALKQKKEGKDPNTTPVSLTAGGLEGFVDHLTDKDKGLSYQSSKIDQLRTSSDPMMRLLREAATQLGLKKSIDTTKDQLRSGESSDLTKKLGDNLPDLLKKEEARLNEIVPNGDLVVARKVNGDVVKVDKFDISGVLSELGPDAEKDFVTGTKMDFGDFIRTAQRLSLAGPEFKGDLVKHLSDGISLILAYHKAKTKQADAAGDKELAQKIQDQFRDISKALQGNGLLPENLAKIIRENVGQAILSEDFRNRAAAGDIHALSESLREQFMKGLKGDNKEIASLAGIKGLVESVTDHGDMITVIDPDSFATQHHKIQWVESSEIKDPTAAEENKNLTSNPSGIGSPISVERLVQSYKRTVDKACDKVFGELAGRITGKDSMVSKKAVDDLVHQTEEKIEASFANVADFQKFITESVIAYKDKKAHNTDATAVENALKKFVEETLNITDGKAKSDLWKATAASGGTTTYTPIGEAVKKIATEILVSPNTGVGDTASNAAINSAFESLVGAIKSRLGTDPASQEKSLLAKLADSKSKERVRTLMSSLRVKLEETEDLSKTLDLDKIVQVFEGTEGKKIAKSLRRLVSSGFQV